MRYLGNKTKLLIYISDFLSEKDLKSKNLIFMDAFAGTASVADYFSKDYKIIANDLMYYSYVLAQAKLNTPKNPFEKLGIDPFRYFNEVDTNNFITGFVYNNFSPNGGRMYFSDENAKMIDFIRTTIEEWYIAEQINENEKFYLIASLLESVSKVSNIAGVYGAYLKTWDPRAVKKMIFFPVETNNRDCKATIYNKDLNILLKEIEGDILYLDPPYTSTQYCSQYHVLETIAKYDNPEIHGVSGQRDHSETSSDFSRKGFAEKAFEDIIANAKFKHIILSYSPDGILSKSFIEAILKRYGKKETYIFKEIDYRKYKNAKTDKEKKHCEYLFYIEKNENYVISSPLNYIGGKYDIIPFLKENMPEEIETFYDLFGGGANVTVNVNANKIIYNEYNFIVKDLIENIAKSDIVDLHKYLSKTIIKFGLSKNNKEAYNKLREQYNAKPIEKRDFRDLLLLIVFGFQHQIRFNSNFEFNNPVGLSDFNIDMLEKLYSFCGEIKRKYVEFFTDTYLKHEEEITVNDFVYCDPPYLITCGAYNDGKRGFNGWDEKQEIELLSFLERLNQKNVKFMLSNVIEHNGKENSILKNWVEQHNFKVIDCNIKTRKNRKEIIVINY